MVFEQTTLLQVFGGNMGYDVKIPRGCLASIGIAVLLWTIGGASSAQENQGISKPFAASQAISQARTSKEQQTSQPILQHRDPRYRLCTGDIFELTFPFTPDFNQTLTILPDGFITLKELGDLHVAGKTVSEVTELLKTAYAKILHDPVVNIALKDFEKPYFIAGGEIGRPGKYDLRGDTTLTQGIAIAGGFNESSKHSQVLLFRRVSNNWVEVKVLDVKKMFQAANLTEDLHLQPGDMFFVPQNRVSKIRKWIPYTSISAGVSPGF
jgi:polysaccharide export outer membrane protein